MQPFLLDESNALGKAVQLVGYGGVLLLLLLGAALVPLGRNAFARPPAANGTGRAPFLFVLCVLALLAVGVLVRYCFNSAFS